MGVSSYLFGHGLAAVAPGHGQVALGAKKVALTWTGPDLDLGAGLSATFFAPSTTWP